MVKRFHILFLVGLMMVSCSPRALHEAQGVVAQADSMRAEGRMYDDSLALAQAYGTLGQWSWFHADEYAHACYHYGRLLREKDNPVEAMQCFINASHTPTRDNHILGRVYSNMGSICHLASEFQLSYEMYEHSAEIFMQAGDSIAYFYALNDMAFELADMADSASCMALLQKLKPITELSEQYMLIHAELYMKCKRYDSAIYYAHKCHSYKLRSTRYLILAQSYSYLGIKDSATYYASEVALHTESLYNLNNALYVLTNDDESKDKTGIRETAADRADVQKLLEIRQGKLSQAVQLLEQDLARKPDWRGYALAFVIVISVVALAVSVRVWKKRKQQMNKQVSSLADQQADTIIESIKKHIDVSNLEDTLHWKDYSAMKSEADLYMGGIVSKLEAYHLNEVEIRFCVLTVMGFSLKQIADTIHYGYPSGIKTLKKRIADKLSTTPPKLRDFLLHMLPKT